MFLAESVCQHFDVFPDLSFNLNEDEKSCVKINQRGSVSSLGSDCVVWPIRGFFLGE